MAEIRYRKLVPGGEDHFYHPFEGPAQPSLAVDENGRIHILAGRYVVTSGGIEDRESNEPNNVNTLSIQSEFIPKRPKTLTDLGKLESIRYKSNSSENELRFSRHAPPILSHDENGNLHVLRGQYRNPLGAEKMRRSRSHRRSRKHHSMFRMNPSSRSSSMGGGSRIQRAILGSLVVGSVASMTIVGLDVLLTKFAPTLTGDMRAAAKIALGVLGAVVIGPSNPAIATGVGAGGVADGVLDLYSRYVAPQLASFLAPAAPQMYAPAQRASLPAGYAPFNAQSCAVPMAAYR